MKVIFLFEIFKIKFNFENAKKKVENLFCLWESCIWKCCYKLSVLRREYMLSAVNGLTKNPKIFHITHRDFSTWNSSSRINKYGKGAVVQLWIVFQSVYHVTCQRVLLKRTFLHIYLTTFFGFSKFKNTWPMRVIFFSKMFKIVS